MRVKEHQEESLWELDGKTLKELQIAWLPDLLVKYGPDARIDIQSSGFSNDWPELWVTWEREETEAERARRLKELAKRRKAKKKRQAINAEQEKKLYAKLKKKYEDT